MDKKYLQGKADLTEEAKSGIFKITNIKYDITDEDAVDNGMTITALKAKLPTTFITGCDYYNEDDLEAELADYISDETGFCVAHFDYEDISVNDDRTEMPWDYGKHFD